MNLDLDFFKEWSKGENPNGQRSIWLRLPNPRYIEYPDYGPGKCVYCGGPLPSRHQKYCCDEHMKEYYITSQTTMLYTWNDFRFLILKRDHYKCQEDKCNKPGNEVHHIVPIHKGGRQFDPDNCITLCGKCHKRRHRKRSREPSSGQRSLNTFDLNTVDHI